MPETAEEKKFRIQQGVVKRLAKEHKSYIDEVYRFLIIGWTIPNSYHLVLTIYVRSYMHI